MDISRSRQHLFVVRQLTSRELKRKYARSYLGILWSVLNPLLSMVVLSLIFSQIFRRSIENYPIYYLTGYLLWQAFTGATSTAMTTLTDNRLLLLKVKFPMELLLFARVYTAMVNLMYSLAAYVVMLMVFRVSFKWTMLLFLPILLLLFLFAMGLSFLLALAYASFGDVKYLYSVALTLWMYCSAIFYPAEQLEGVIHTIILNNPIYVYIHCMRKAVMYGTLPERGEWARMILWGMCMYLAGHLVFHRNRNAIMQKL